MARRAVKVTTVAAFTLAVSAVAGLTAAYATPPNTVKTHVSIKSSGLTFSGKVTASDSNCVLGRRVTLHRTNGNILGHFTTGPNGRWKITASGSAGISLGHFYATVAKRTVGALVCKAATSPTIPLHH